jgi:hypothetical protein
MSKPGTEPERSIGAFESGVLSIVEDLHAREIGLDAMEGAVALVDWYVCD